MKGFERKISQLLCRWLGLSQNLHSIVLNRHKDMLKFLIECIVEEFKVTKAKDVRQKKGVAKQSDGQGCN